MSESELQFTYEFPEWEFQNQLKDNTNFLYCEPFTVTKYGQDWIIHTRNPEPPTKLITVPSIDPDHYEIEVDHETHTYFMKDQRKRYHINVEIFRNTLQSSNTDYTPINPTIVYRQISYISPTYPLMVFQDIDDHKKAIIHVRYRNDVLYDGLIYIFVNGSMIQCLQVGGFVQTFETKFPVDLMCKKTNIFIIKTNMTEENKTPICGEVQLQIFIF